MNVTPRCHACGSDEIRTLDNVLVTAEICEWAAVDGKLTPGYSGDSTVHWDSAEPARKDTPYECNDCNVPISEQQLFDSLPKSVRAKIIKQRLTK